METKNYVIICDKINSLIKKEMKQLEVSNFSVTVDKLADEIATFLNIDKNSFDIVNFGRSLDYTKTLDSYGIENGTILYLLKKVTNDELLITNKNETENNETREPFNLSTENQGMCIALKSALLNSSFRQVIENLSEFENRENLMTVNNELRNDPSLFGILSDSELLHAYISKNNIRNVLKRYPHFLEVATHVSATFHEELNSSSSMNWNYRLNYALENNSDDEMEESETSSLTSSNNSMRRLSDPSLTSIIMEAYRHRQNQNQNSSLNSISNLSLNANQSSLNNSIITQDMLQQALQSTNSSSNLASSQNTSQNSNRTTSAPPRRETRTPAQILIGWAPQLTQMRELGITDDIVAIQALEATNGDVQAAINIIFSDTA